MQLVVLKKEGDRPFVLFDFICQGDRRFLCLKLWPVTDDHDPGFIDELSIAGVQAGLSKAKPRKGRSRTCAKADMTGMSASDAALQLDRALAHLHASLDVGV